MLNKAEREEMNNLSRQAFGSATKWQKFASEGVLETVTREVQETKPGGTVAYKEEGSDEVKFVPAEDEIITTKIPVLINGKPYKQRRYPSVAELKEVMLKQIEAYRQMMEKHFAEQKAKEDAEKQKQLESEVNKKIAGTAVY